MNISNTILYFGS